MLLFMQHSPIHIMHLKANRLPDVLSYLLAFRANVLSLFYHVFTIVPPCFSAHRFMLSYIVSCNNAAFCVAFGLQGIIHARTLKDAVQTRLVCEVL